MPKYSNIGELTSELLHEFIDKIIVHHKEKVFGETIQRVEIYYKMIGQVQIPQLSRSQKDGYKKYFGRIKKSRWIVNQSTLQKENHKNIPCPLWYSALVLVVIRDLRETSSDAGSSHLQCLPNLAFVLNR